MKIQKQFYRVFFGLVFAILLAVPFFVSAHPGNTDSYGCHTCRTNCSSWGLSYGEYHCHQSKGLPQPYDPIRSHYDSSGGYTEPWPDYSYPSSDSNYSYPSTPSCPIMSSYNSISGDCECYAGYIAEGGSCVSGDSYCHRKYGYNSNYNFISKTCECDYGYMLDSSGQCVSQNSYCQNIFGYNSEYNILTDKCECKDGYVADSSGNSCISGDSYCYSKYGYNSRFNSYKESCECRSGYILNSSKTKCISEDEWCEDIFGYNSRSNVVTGQCECKSGYVVDKDTSKCVIAPITKSLVIPADNYKPPVVAQPKAIEKSKPMPSLIILQQKPITNSTVNNKPIENKKEEQKEKPKNEEKFIPQEKNNPPIAVTKSGAENLKSKELIANISGAVKGFFKKIFSKIF